MTHEHWMRQALKQALKGLGKTSPNPCVGCVIVGKGKLLGQGWHRRAGQPHAEIEAIRDAHRRGNNLKGSTVYVTLEPCCTHGRTPPCTEALIREKVARVVVAATDPNPSHGGKGYRLLRRAGIEVITGVLQQEANALNRAFNHWIVTGRPWIIAKAALSVDGKLNRPAGQGQWLTGEKARKDVHLLRSRCDAILVGGETARRDNPRLTVRLPGYTRRQPWRVVHTLSGKLPPTLHLFSDEHADRTLVYQNKSWNHLLKDLGKKGVTCLLVEGGAKVFGGLAQKNLINEVALYIAPLDFSGHSPQSGLADASILLQISLKETRLSRVGPDLKVEGLALPT